MWLISFRCCCANWVSLAALPGPDDAPAIYLHHNPGAYEVVKRLLGHQNIQTTINFYCGRETTQANQEFGKIIRRQIKFKEDA